jgi:hypothetical protein
MLRPAAALAVSILVLGSPQPGLGQADDAFEAAKDQAYELGTILAAVRLCDGASKRDALFHQFMVAKRKRGFTGDRTAQIAAMAGAGEGVTDPRPSVCSEESSAERRAFIERVWQTW